MMEHADTQAIFTSVASFNASNSLWGFGERLWKALYVEDDDGVD
jgi:hypothetical protein